MSRVWHDGQRRPLLTTAALDPTDHELRVTLSPLNSAKRSPAVTALCEHVNKTKTTFLAANLPMRFAVAGYPRVIEPDKFRRGYVRSSKTTLRVRRFVALQARQRQESVPISRTEHFQM